MLFSLFLMSSAFFWASFSFDSFSFFLNWKKSVSRSRILSMTRNLGSRAKRAANSLNRFPFQFCNISSNLAIFSSFAAFRASTSPCAFSARKSSNAWRRDCGCSWKPFTVVKMQQNVYMLPKEIDRPFQVWRVRVRKWRMRRYCAPIAARWTARCVSRGSFLRATFPPWPRASFWSRLGLRPLISPFSPVVPRLPFLFESASLLPVLLPIFIHALKFV